MKIGLNLEWFKEEMLKDEKNYKHYNFDYYGK